MKFLSAYKLLESTGEYEIIAPSEKKVDEAVANGNAELVATVKITHTRTETADMRTKAGRRIYHMNARAFGIHESTQKHGRTVNEEAETELMGSRTVGMNHKPDKLNHSWTWIDVGAIQNELKDKGITVTEQHGQALVTKDWDEEPVPGTPGVDGPYGEGSSSVMYFWITTERTWMIKFSGTPDAFEAIELDEDVVTDLIKKHIPGLLEEPESASYVVDVNVKSNY